MRRLVLASVLMLVSFTIAKAGDAPLPPDLKITSPAAGVPANIAKFSGKWGDSKWDGRLDNILVVESVQGSGAATVVYAWGDYAKWNIQRGWDREKATINGTTLHIRLLDASGSIYANVDYEFQSDGTLAGTYQRPGNPNASQVVLHRQ